MAHLPTIPVPKRILAAPDEEAVHRDRSASPDSEPEREVARAPGADRGDPREKDLSGTTGRLFARAASRHVRRARSAGSPAKTTKRAPAGPLPSARKPGRWQQGRRGCSASRHSPPGGDKARETSDGRRYRAPVRMDAVVVAASAGNLRKLSGLLRFLLLRALGIIWGRSAAWRRDLAVLGRRSGPGPSAVLQRSASTSSPLAALHLQDELRQRHVGDELRRCCGWRL